MAGGADHTAICVQCGHTAKQAGSGKSNARAAYPLATDDKDTMKLLDVMAKRAHNLRRRL